VFELRFSTDLAAPRADVAAVVSTMDGVNAELRPCVRMTFPARWARLDGAPVDRLLFRSWLLLFGVLPVDRHALRLAAITPGEGFVEESTSWLQRRWRHQRRLADLPGGCRVEDHLVVQPRLRLAEPLVRLIVGAVFRHRHRRLASRFGRA
jgi:hypothetical protein